MSPTKPKYPKSQISSLPIHVSETPSVNRNITSEPQTVSVPSVTLVKTEPKVEIPEWIAPLAETITPHMPGPIPFDRLPIKTAEELEAIANPPPHETTTTYSGNKSYTTPGDSAADHPQFDDGYWDPEAWHGGWF